MIYTSTMTKKGQITIPKAIRDTLSLETGERLSVELAKEKKEITIRPYPDILELAGKFKVKKQNRMDAVQTREYMATHYERV